MFNDKKSNIVSKKSRNVEVEARFNEYSMGRGVSVHTFQRVLDILGPNYEETNTIDYIQNINDGVGSYGGIRKTTQDGKKDVWITKSGTSVFKRNDYNVKLSMSTEIPTTEPEEFTHNISREKKRFSIDLVHSKVDMTIIYTTNDKGSRSGPEYEIELELSDFDRFDEFGTYCFYVLSLIQDTPYVYTKKEYNDVILGLNNSLGSGITNAGNRKNIIDSRMLTKPRNLHLSDMVYGGLVGNNITRYNVLYKADGKRKLFVTHGNSVWLLMYPSFVSKIGNFDGTVPNIGGFILDGELIESGNDDDNRFLIFDVLSVPVEGIPSTKIQILPFSHRMHNMGENIEMLNKLDTLTTLRMKYFKQITDVSSFYKIMNEMESERGNLDYETDGYVFVPEIIHRSVSKFSSVNQYLPTRKTHNRNLKKTADLCKYKPPNMITIDFAVYRNSDGLIELKVMDGDISTMFEPKYPLAFDGLTMVDHDNEITANISDGTIVEYKWDTRMLVPVRIRSDKVRANSKAIAYGDNWNMMIIPLKLSTMLGKDITLMSKYHNSIKSKIYNKSSKSFKLMPTLLDIGSGKGGDIGKWNGKFAKVIAVEPNKEYIIEFSSRCHSIMGFVPQVIENIRDIKKIDSSKRLILINAKGENHELITKVVKKYTGGKVDVISSMMSLSFFWENSNIFTNLMKTIRNNLSDSGEFIFTTIDGDKILETFKPPIRVPTDEISNMLKLNDENITMEFNGNYINVDYKGTIVSKQKEWLVHLSDLMLELKRYKITDVSDMNHERFVSPGANSIIKLYTSGKFVPMKATKINFKGKKIVKRVVRKNVGVGMEFVPKKTNEKAEIKTKIIETSEIPIIIYRIKEKGSELYPMFTTLNTKTGVGHGIDSTSEVVLTIDGTDVIKVTRISSNRTNSFFDCILKMAYHEYASNSDYIGRMNALDNIKRDVISILGSPSKGGTQYDFVLDGILPFYAQKEKEGNIYVDRLGNIISYDLAKMQKAMTESTTLSDLYYETVAGFLLVDLYVLDMNKEIDLLYFPYSQVKEKSVVIMSNSDGRCEGIGIKNKNNLIQSTFSKESDFIRMLRETSDF
ncbi:MAG: hypothetical protein COA94_02075 [Rickettsiales bacterium]|nr:MAG: hypothetical protein COA94_02075 [Rickettsiales bacterium]